MSKAKRRRQQTKRAAFVLDRPALLTMPPDLLAGFWHSRKLARRLSEWLYPRP